MIQEQFKGRGVTTAGVAPIEAGALRQNTLKKLGLAAQGLILQGRYQNAKDKVDEAVRIKFEPIENKLKIAELQYTLNKDRLEREDKKRADKLAFNLSERNRLLTEQKDNFGIGQGLALTALKNNPGNQGVQMIVNQALKLDPLSPDYLQKVFSLVGQYQTDPNKIAQDLADLKYKQAQTKNIEADTSLTPLKKRQLISSIEENEASTRKIEAEIEAAKPLDVSTLLSDTSLPSDKKNSIVISALLGSSKVSATAKTQLQRVLGVVNSAKQLADNNTSGGFAGINPITGLLDLQYPFTDTSIIPFRSAMKKQTSISNEQYINGIKLAVGYWASGATLTAQQLKLVDGMTPTMADKDSQVRTKLNALTDFMLNQAKSVLQSEGIEFTPEKVNLFETKDMIEKLSPEQKAELERQGLLPDWAK